MAGAVESKPCLGYESQTKAIEALHIKGFSPSDIARLCECSRDNVYAAVAGYRRRTGNFIKHPSMEKKRDPIPREGKLWDTEEDRQRREIAKRAARGARAQLLAIMAEGQNAQ